MSGVTPTPWIETSPGREVLRDGELERGLVGRDVGEDELHAALAERLLADDDRAIVVLERARDDLARAGATSRSRARRSGSSARCPRRWASFSSRPSAVPTVATITPSREELVGDARRLIEQAARVAAQVEDEALEFGAFLRNSASASSSLGRRARLELLEAHVADVALEQPALDRLAP